MMKHTSKSVLSVLLAVLMMLSLLPAGILAGALDEMNADNTIYVSANGDDANAGTQESPVKTIAKAVELLEAGDKSKDGYVYLLSDILLELSDPNAVGKLDPINNLYLAPKHERHIIFTGDNAAKPTLTLLVNAVLYNGNLAATGTSQRHGGAQVNMYLNGPTTLDNIIVTPIGDKENWIVFPADYTYTLSEAQCTEYGVPLGSKFVFHAGDYLYKNYELAVDPENEGYVIDVSERSAGVNDEKHYVMIERFAWTITDPLVVTENGQMLCEDRDLEADRQTALLPNTSYPYPFYTHRLVVANDFAFYSVRDPNLFNSCYFQSAFISQVAGYDFPEEITVVLGGDFYTRFFYGVDTTVPAGSTVNLVWDTATTISSGNMRFYPFYATASAKDPEGNPICTPNLLCTVNYVIRRPGIKLDGSTDVANMTSSTADGKGTYNLVIEDFSNNFGDGAGLLLPGFESIYFKGVEDTFTFDFEALPAVGYNTIRFDEGAILDLSGVALARNFKLDIVKAGEDWADLSFDVAYADSEEILNSLSLTPELDAIGDLVWNEDNMSVQFVLSQGSVAFDKGDATDDITMPSATESFRAGEQITLPAPETTELSDGRKFSGWKNSKGDVCLPGEKYAITVNGVETLTAVWASGIANLVFESGIDGVVADAAMKYQAGTAVVLPNGLRGQVYEKDGRDVTFYGWTIDGTFYHAGDTYILGVSDVTATAVWAPVVYVNGSYSGESDGSYAKPYADLAAASTALTAKLTANDAAGAFVLTGDTSADTPVFSINGKPVLYTALNAATTITLGGMTNPQGGVAFDHITYTTPANVHYAPFGDFYVGPDTTSVRAWASITTSYGVVPAGIVANVRIYGTVTINYINHGSGNANTMNVYLGTDDPADPVPVIVQDVYLTHQSSSQSNDTFVVRAAKIPAFYLAETGAKRVHAGENNLVIGKRAQITAIYDSNATAATSQNASLTLDNTLREVIFDGYKGNINFIHSAHTFNLNGLYSVKFINGADVTFTAADGILAIATAKGNTVNGSFYVEEGSSFSGIDVVGVVINNGAEVYTELNPVAGTAYLWDGSAWDVASSVSFDTDVDGLTVEAISGLSGSVVVLPNDLVGLIISKGDEEVSFAGWDIGGTVYAGGDSYILGASDVTATAVWTSVTKLSFVTDIDGVTLDPVGAQPGDEYVLQAALRGQVYNKDGRDVTFYGYMIDGKYYDAGDTFTFGNASSIATIVWAPVVYVNGSYTGTDSDGSKNKPYVEGLDAYAALADVLTEDDYAGAVVLLGNTDLTSTAAGTSGLFEADILADIGKPVLFTATDKSYQLSIVTASALRFAGSISLDHITFSTNAARYWNPAKDFYIGKLATQTGSTFRFAATSSTASVVNYKIYNSMRIDPISIGNGLSGVLPFVQTANLYIGTGEADSQPICTSLYPDHNYHTRANMNVEIRSGTVTTLYTTVIRTDANKSFVGSFNVTIGKGATVGTINDGPTSIYANNYTNTATWYMNEMTRTITFDGYVGNVKYNHVPFTLMANGLDAVSFINGANVTFTESTNLPVIAHANGNGLVYIDSTSSYSGISIVGCANTDSAETTETFTAVEIQKDVLNVWNGESWTVGTFGKALGASIRTETPYGIRFGFAGNEYSLGAVLGQSVVEKGVLIMRTSMLEGNLTVDTENVLKIVAAKPLSVGQYNQFTGVLVDNVDASDEAWLEAWGDVEFTACAYFTLEDGTVVYSDSIVRSINGVKAELA